MTLLDERERIAHDLHDQVIQQLFAAGMDLQGTVARSHSAEVTNRLTRTIDSLQATIETIRTTIFALQHDASGRADVAQRINALIATLTEDRDLVTTIHTSGPLTAVSDTLAEHIESVLTEAISNAVRHSAAEHLTVAIGVADDVVLDITDDGRGIPATNTRFSGLTNMRRRAERLGGHCEISTPATGGTHVHWAVPLQ